MTGELFVIAILFLTMVLLIIPMGLAVFIIINAVIESFNDERK